MSDVSSTASRGDNDGNGANGNVDPVGVGSPSIFSSSSSSGSMALQPLQLGETCSYYARNMYSGCRWPRTCQSCLDTAGCMVSDAGWCVSPQQAAYEPRQDYQNAIDGGLVLPNTTANNTAINALQQWQFRAGEVQYCPRNDAVCQQCVRQNFYRGRNTPPDSRFCMGANGCVCVDVCERRWYVRTECPTVSVASNATRLPSPSPTAAYPNGYYMSNESMTERIWRSMLGMVLFAVVCLLVLLRQRKKTEARERATQEERQRRQEARRQRRHARATELGVNPLNLTGWETYRRDLIDKEKLRLAGGGDEAKQDDGSSGDESSSDEEVIRSPRVLGDASQAVYVRMEEGGAGELSNPSSSPPATSTSAASGMVHGTPAPTAQRDALPSLQLAAPMQRGATRRGL